MGCVNTKQKQHQAVLDLHSAARRGAAQEVERILGKSQVAVDTRDSHGATALLVAAQAGNAEVVRLLLKCKACVTARSSSGETPLIAAVTNAHPEVIEAIIEMCSLEITQDHKNDALVLAARNGIHEVVKVLLAAEADVNAQDRCENSALICASKKGHIEVIKALLESRAYTESKDSYGWTALKWAAWEGHEAVLKCLIEGKADPMAKDEYGASAIALAIAAGHTGFVHMLVQCNIEKDLLSEGALLAAHYGHPDCLTFLLAHGADINARDKVTHSTPVINGVKRGHSAVVQALLDRGANPDLVDNTGNTPLIHAVMTGHQEIVKMLLEAHADVDICNNQGECALLHAVSRLGIVQMLLRHGAIMSAAPAASGSSVLSAVLKSKNHAVIQSFATRGADFESLGQNVDVTDATNSLLSEMRGSLEQELHDYKEGLHEALVLSRGSLSPDQIGIVMEYC